LKEQLHGPGELVAAVHQQAGHAKQHGRVRVVAAGVHDAWCLRPVLDVVLLENRQGIHVGSQKDGFPPAWLPPADDPGHAGLRDASAHIFDAKRAQPVGHDPSRAHLLKRQLRMLVKIAPVCHHAGHDLVDIVAQRRLSHLVVLLAASC
jgi:hypothetical protein